MKTRLHHLVHAAAERVKTAPLSEARQAATEFANQVHDAILELEGRIERLETLAGLMNGAESPNALKGGAEWPS